MKILLKQLLLVVFFVSSISCQTHDLKKAMVQFDQAFIPVLMATDEGNIYQAKSGVFYLEFQWQKLNKKYGNLLAGNEDWQETFRRVNEWLGDAYFAIDNNNAELACNQLEHVKYELMELRRIQGIDYYLDDLFDFKLITDRITRIAHDDKLKLLEWKEYADLVKATQVSWRIIKSKPVDFQVYELNKEKVLLLRKYQNNMSTILDDLVMSLDSADQAAVAKQTQALDPAMRQLIRLFGNFEEDRTYFAQGS